jgi:hypothetical protein
MTMKGTRATRTRTARSRSAAVIGATDMDERKTVRAILNLEPGTYTYLCSIPGQYQTGQHRMLVVR